MQLQIDRLHVADLSPADFFSRYYQTEQPVLVSGLTHDHSGELQQHIWDIAHHSSARRLTGHIAVSRTQLPAQLAEPQLVTAVLARKDIALKAQPLKLWMQPAGHCTHLHYDGNSLHGLNWQLSGRKSWLLVSPNTPPRFMPFSQVAQTAAGWQPNPSQHDYMAITTEPGDMLFVPRYWSHQVHSLEACNVNLNWVWTPHQRNTQVAVGRRECAVLKLRWLLGRFGGFKYGVHIHNYADAGQNLLRTYTNALPRGLLLKTLLVELYNIVSSVPHRRSVASRMAQMSTNNFAHPP